MMIPVTSQVSISDWNIRYENLSKEVPIYEYIVHQVPPLWSDINQEWSEPDNWTEERLIGWETVYYDGDRIGLTIDGVDYSMDNNIVGSTLVEWKYPIGDRNFEEYGLCRRYEIEKGLCTQSRLP